MKKLLLVLIATSGVWFSTQAQTSTYDWNMLDASDEIGTTTNFSCAWLEGTMIIPGYDDDPGPGCSLCVPGNVSISRPTDLVDIDIVIGKVVKRTGVHRSSALWSWCYSTNTLTSQEIAALTSEITQDYYDWGYFCFLRRLEDSSPCPLDGMPEFVAEDDPYDIYSRNDAWKAAPSKVFPFPIVAPQCLGTPCPFTNYYVANFTGVPRGHYLLYVVDDFLQDSSGHEQIVRKIPINVTDLVVLPPGCAVTSPTNGAVLRLGQPVPITYRLNSLNGVLSWKQLNVYAGGDQLLHRTYNWDTRTTVIGETVVWTPTRSGSQTIELLGYDTACQYLSNANGTNRINVTVIDGNLASPGTFTAPAFTPNGIFRTEALGQIGGVYRIDGSTNLMSWVELMRYTNTGGPFLFQDSNSSTFPKRFYRSVGLP